MIRQHIYFSGRVQAVGFRFRAQMNATQLGLTGWVRNLFDGRVEAEVQGEIEQINRFINKMKNEQWIDITDMEVEDIPVEKVLKMCKMITSKKVSYIIDEKGVLGPTDSPADNPTYFWDLFLHRKKFIG